MIWRMRLDLVFLLGWTASGGVFWGVCDLIMILGSLSANGWGCVPVLLVVGCPTLAVQHWSLLFFEWRCILLLRRWSLGELSPIDVMWGLEVSGGPVS